MRRKQNKKLSKKPETLVPLIVERDEDGFYVVECPLFQGCYTQGKTLDDALSNIREVIELCLEEKENKYLFASYRPSELSIHAIAISAHNTV